MIAWTPLDYDLPTKGQIAVGRVLPDDWTVPYAFTGGLALSRDLRGDKSIILMFHDLQYFVVEKRLDPEAVHQAFLQIDEYAAIFEHQEGYGYAERM